MVILWLKIQSLPDGFKLFTPEVRSENVQIIVLPVMKCDVRSWLHIIECNCGTL